MPYRTGPPARTDGPTRPLRNSQPTVRPRLTSLRSRSRIPRGSRPKARRYSSCTTLTPASPNSTSKAKEIPLTGAEVAPEEANRWLKSAAACWFRPRRRDRELSADTPARPAVARRNGKAHSSSVPVRIMAWFMKSSASSRCHRSSAAEPEYLSSAASIPRRTRRPKRGRSVTIGVFQRGLDVVPERTRDAGRGADHPAEPDHRRDGLQHPGDLAFGRPRRQRLAAAPFQADLRRPDRRQHPHPHQRRGPGIQAAGPGQAEHEPGLIADEPLVDDRQPAQDLLESHRPAHVASAHRWHQCTPARGGFHRPNEVKKDGSQPSGIRVARRRPARLRPETSLALILTALTAPVAPASSASPTAKKMTPSGRAPSTRA